MFDCLCLVASCSLELLQLMWRDTRTGFPLYRSHFLTVCNQIWWKILCFKEVYKNFLEIFGTVDSSVCWRLWPQRQLPYCSSFGVKQKTCLLLKMNALYSAIFFIRKTLYWKNKPFFFASILFAAYSTQATSHRSTYIMATQSDKFFDREFDRA